MPRVDVVVECPVYESFRVQQVAGMFDVPLGPKCREQFSVELPDLSEPWQIGLIVGPSGSGKSTVARSAYGDQLYRQKSWPGKKAVIDGFGAIPTKQITQTLSAVGFSSPPSWAKPYAVLSNGEKFRCDLARAMLQDASESPLVAFDEFSSVVDRTVAKVTSAAVAKAIRGGRVERRFVAISCHYDIAEWLQPDWVVDMATGTLARGRLQRPALRIDIFRCGSGAWRLFAKHHYLSATLHRSTQCYLATWEGQAVGFCGVLPMLGRRGCDRISRLVVLPDYQGIGVGRRLLEAVCVLRAEAGRQVGITTSHPALRQALSADRNWRCAAVRKMGNRGSNRICPRYRGSRGRAVVSFKYLGGDGSGQGPGQHGLEKVAK